MAAGLEKDGSRTYSDIITSHPEIEKAAARLKEMLEQIKPEDAAMSKVAQGVSAYKPINASGASAAKDDGAGRAASAGG